MTKFEAIDHINVNLTICRAVTEALPNIKTANVRDEYTTAMGYALKLIEDNLKAITAGGLN